MRAPVYLHVTLRHIFNAAIKLSRAGVWNTPQRAGGDAGAPSKQARTTTKTVAKL
jgi:hypothetical protein